MQDKNTLGQAFNETADVSTSVFFNYLKEWFNVDTAHKTLKVFEKMGLPAPQERREFLQSIDGALIFLNKYGVVIRIEEPRKTGEFRSDKINDNGRIMKPLGSIQIGSVIIEMHAGLPPAKKLADNERLRKNLAKDGIEYWDFKLSNTGLSPIKTAQHPEGEPVVIDRGAVRRLTESIQPVRDSLLFARAAKPADPEWMEQHDEFFAPLRDALKAAWADPANMKAFWDMCAEWVQQEKLVAGWNKPQSAEAMTEKCVWGSNRKTGMAALAAEGYEARMRSGGRKPEIKIFYSSLNR